VKEINSRGNLALETGKLIFHSKNCHVYERQYKLVKELLSPQTGSKMARLAQTMKDAKEEERE
jgi:thymidylate synthase